MHPRKKKNREENKVNIEAEKNVSSEKTIDFLFAEFAIRLPSFPHPGFVNERWKRRPIRCLFSAEQSIPRASTSIINETNENFVASSDTVFDYSDGAE